MVSHIAVVEPDGPSCIGTTDDLGGIKGSNPVRGEDLQQVVGIEGERMAHAHPYPGFVHNAGGEGAGAAPGEEGQTVGASSAGWGTPKEGLIVRRGGAWELGKGHGVQSWAARGGAQGGRKGRAVSKVVAQC